MRTITKSFDIYTFPELSQEAKEKVREWYLEGQEPFIYTNMCLERLSEFFPESDLKVQYSLGYCQGDGFNIYGKIHLDELLEKIQEHFSEKEIRFFKWAFSEFDSSYEMPVNNHYCYCICSRNDFIEDLLYDMECNYIRDIPEKVMEKFNRLAGEYLNSLCKDFEDQGYDYFYEVSEEDLQENCEANEYEFLENGEWLQLPMDMEKLHSIYNKIVGENQEHIILDYNSPFSIEEYENIFNLNETLENLSKELDSDILTVLFKVNPNREEVLKAIENDTFDIINVDAVSSGWNASFDCEEIFGMVLNEEGYNNLFSQPIPEEMIDYMDFAQIYTCLSVNNGWQSVDVGNVTYLVRFW